MLIRERFGVRPVGNQELQLSLPLSARLANDTHSTLEPADDIPFVLTIERRVDPWR
jgi:hypothetical protein